MVKIVHETGNFSVLATPFPKNGAAEPLQRRPQFLVFDGRHLAAELRRLGFAQRLETRSGRNGGRPHRLLDNPDAADRVVAEEGVDAMAAKSASG